MKIPAEHSDLVAGVLLHAGRPLTPAEIERATGLPLRQVRRVLSTSRFVASRREGAPGRPWVWAPSGPEHGTRPVRYVDLTHPEGVLRASGELGVPVTPDEAEGVARLMQAIAARRPRRRGKA